MATGEPAPPETVRRFEEVRVEELDEAIQRLKEETRKLKCERRCILRKWEREKEEAARKEVLDALREGEMQFYINPVTGTCIYEDTPGVAFHEVVVDVEDVEYTNEYEGGGQAWPTYTDAGSTWKYDTAVHPADLLEQARKQGLTVTDMDEMPSVGEKFGYSSSDYRSGSAAMTITVQYVTKATTKKRKMKK